MFKQTLGSSNLRSAGTCSGSNAEQWAFKASRFKRGDGAVQREQHLHQKPIKTSRCQRFGPKGLLSSGECSGHIRLARPLLRFLHTPIRRWRACAPCQGPINYRVRYKQPVAYLQHRANLSYQEEFDVPNK